MFRLKSITIFICTFCAFFITDLSFAVNLDLDFSSHYNLKYDSASHAVLSGNGGLAAGDVNGNGKPDIIVSEIAGKYNDRANCGGVYVIFDDLIDNYSGIGNYADATAEGNYSIRFEGAVAGDNIGHESVYVKDVDGNGISDILIGTYHSDPKGRGNAGYFYVIYDSVIRNFTGAGHKLDLLEKTSYSIRFDGATTHDHFGGTTISVADLNNNGHNDLVIGGGTADYNGKTDSGSIWIIYDSVFKDLTGTGNEIDMLDSGSYNIRFDGETASDGLGNYCLTTADINDNGIPDILVGASGYNSSSGVVYVIYDSIFTSISGTNQTRLLSAAGMYSLKILGPTGSRVGRNLLSIADFDHNGKMDIVIPAQLTSFNAQPNSGSLYLVYDNVIDNYNDSINSIDLSNAENYNLRLDGGITDGGLFINSNTTDIDNDGTIDLIANFSNQEMKGNHYFIYNSDLANPSIGQSLNLSDETNYKYKVAGEFFSMSGYLNLIDFNLDGKNDILLGMVNYSGYGGVWLVYNYPHNISLNSLSINKASSMLKGAILAPNSTTITSGVQYSIDDASFQGNWFSCNATDGIFDSTSENFVCNLDIANLTQGPHTIYVRSYDVNQSYTAVSEYVSKSFIYKYTDPYTSTLIDINTNEKSENGQSNSQSEQDRDVEEEIEEQEDSEKTKVQLEKLLIYITPIVGLVVLPATILYFLGRPKK